MLREWPGGEHQPIAFCHIEGYEETVSVQTEDGNERSKYNEPEVKHVVSTNVYMGVCVRVCGGMCVDVDHPIKVFVCLSSF